MQGFHQGGLAILQVTSYYRNQSIVKDCNLTLTYLYFVLDSMILLGSIQRPQLQSLLNQHMQKLLQTSSNAESEDALCARPETPDSSQLQSE